MSCPSCREHWDGVIPIGEAAAREGQDRHRRTKRVEADEESDEEEAEWRTMGSRRKSGLEQAVVVRSLMMAVKIKSTVPSIGSAYCNQLPITNAGSTISNL